MQSGELWKKQGWAEPTIAQTFNPNASFIIIADKWQKIGDKNRR